MTACFKNLGVKINPYLNLNLLSDPHCNIGWTPPDCTGPAVAMHPLKTVEEWNKCYEAAHHGEDGDDCAACQGGGGQCCGNACAAPGSKCCKSPLVEKRRWYPVTKDTKCAF